MKHIIVNVTSQSCSLIKLEVVCLNYSESELKEMGLRVYREMKVKMCADLHSESLVAITAADNVYLVYEHTEHSSCSGGDI